MISSRNGRGPYIATLAHGTVQEQCSKYNKGLEVEGTEWEITSSLSLVRSKIPNCPQLADNCTKIDSSWALFDLLRSNPVLLRLPAWAVETSIDTSIGSPAEPW